MCLLSSETKSETSTEPDKQIKALKDLAFGKAQDLSGRTYPTKTGDELVAGFNPIQDDAFDRIQNSTKLYDNSSFDFAREMAKLYTYSDPMKVGTYTTGYQTAGPAAQVGVHQAGPAEQVGTHQIGKPAEQVRFEGLVDESGRLGSIQGYIDPYLEAVLAPQLRQINEQGAVQRNAIKAGATSAGAFGDARHGVVEADQFRDQGQLVSDTTGAAYSRAWNDAMARRASDRDAFAQEEVFNANSRTARDIYETDAARAADEMNTQLRQALSYYNTDAARAADAANTAAKNQFAMYDADARRGTDQFNSGVRTAADTTNANLRENRLERLITGSQNVANIELARQGLENTMQDRMLAVGDRRQGQAQRIWDANEIERQREFEQQYRNLDVLMSFLTGAPNAQTVTTKTDDGGNGIVNALGSALGSFFG